MASVTKNPLFVHGQQLDTQQPIINSGYNNVPPISIHINYNDTATRSGTNASISVSGGINRMTDSSGGIDYYGFYNYGFKVYAKLSTTNTENATGLTTIIDKRSHTGSGAKDRWGDDGAGSTLFSKATFSSNLSVQTASTASTTVYLQIYFSGGCPDCQRNHSGVANLTKLVWQTSITVPGASGTVVFKRGFGNSDYTLNNVASLPSTPYTAAQGGITNTTQTYDEISYTFIGWNLPSGYSWGDNISGTVNLTSVWDVGNYSLNSHRIGATYTAQFYGYEGSNSIYQVVTIEDINQGCGYQVETNYVAGGNYPVKATSFTPIDHHIQQIVGYPVRSILGNVNSDWTYSYIAYPDGSWNFYTDTTWHTFVDAHGYTQKYQISSTLTAIVTESGNSKTKHYANFYDTNKRYHQISNPVAWLTRLTFIPGTAETKVVKSHWHNPQVWKYRISCGKYATEENAIQGNSWYQDAEVHKYVNGSWRVTNKWRYNNTTREWENCDKDLLINNS